MAIKFGKKSKIKNIILFESIPVYSGNSKHVYNEMVKQNWNKKYRLIWISNGTETIDNKRIKVIYCNCSNPIKKMLNNLYSAYLYNVAKCVILSNEFPTFINGKRKDQYCINLAHGEALKNCSDHYNLPDYIDEVACLSSFLAKYDAINFNCDISKMLPIGYSRNDVLFGPPKDLNSIFNKKFKKCIYWMPTYRQHKNGKVNTSDISFPIVYSEREAQIINRCAIDNDTLIIIKPHPAQDLTRLTSMDMSNIIFINDSFLMVNNIDNYELLRSVDALLSDYSSVYYDYLLCDKPIGLCFDDFDDYNRREGFTVDPEYILAGGQKIYNTEDLCEFICSVSSGEDKLFKNRNRIKETCHQYCDDNSTKRIVDMIEKRLR